MTLLFAIALSLPSLAAEPAPTAPAAAAPTSSAPAAAAPTSTAPAVPAPAREPVDRLLVGTVTKTSSGGTRLVVDRGAADGVVRVGSALDVYALEPGDAGAAAWTSVSRPQIRTVGSAMVVRVRRRSSVLLADAPVAVGDAVDLHARVVPPSAPSMGWDFAVRGLVLDVPEGPLDPWDVYRDDPDALPDDVLLDRFAAAVRATSVPDPQTSPGGRFPGKTLGDVLANTTADDVRAALEMFDAAHEADWGHLDAVALYVDWVRRGAPMSKRELVRDVAGRDDARLQALLDANPGADLAGALYAQAESAGWDGRADFAGQAIAGLDHMAALTSDPRAAWFAARARGIVADEAGDPAAALSLWTPLLDDAPDGYREDLLVDVGDARAATGDGAGAHAAYHELIAAGVASPYVYEADARLLVDAEQYADAADLLRHAIDARSKDPSPYDAKRLARDLADLILCVEDTDPDAAEAAVEQMRAIAKEYGWAEVAVSAQGNAGNVADSRGDPLAAADAWEKAAAMTSGPDAGQFLYRAGKARWDAGQRDAGFALVDRGIDLLREEPSSEQLAWALYELASFEADLGDLAAASDLLHEATTDLGDGDDLIHLDLWAQIGEIERRRGRLPEARAAYERFLSMARAAGDRQSEAEALFYLGNLDQSPDELAQASEIIHERGEDEAAVSSMLFAATFDPAAHRDLAERALAWAEAAKLPGPVRARALATLADSAWEQGDHAGAYELAERALALDPSVGNAAAIAGYDLAQDDPDAARARMEGLPQDGSQTAGWARRSIELSLAWRLGRLDDALALAHEGRREMAGSGMAEAGAYTTLAGVSLARGDLGDADRAARRAVALARTYSPELALTAAACQAGQVALALGDVDGAAAYAEDARNTAKTASARVEAAMLAARVAAAKGDGAGAFARLDDAVSDATIAGKIAERQLRLTRAEIAITLGDADAVGLVDAAGEGLVAERDPMGAIRVALARGRALSAEPGAGAGAGAGAGGKDATQQAAVAFRDAVARAREVGDRGSLADALVGLAGVEADPAAAIADLREALATRDAMQAGLDPEVALRLRTSDRAWDQLAELLGTSGRAGEAADVLAARLVLPRAEASPVAADLPLRDLFLKLGQANPDLDERMAVQLDQLVTLQASLAADEAVLEPVVLPDRVVVVVVRGGRAPAYAEVAVREEDVDRDAEAARRFLDTPTTDWGATRGVRIRTASSAKVDPKASSKGLYDVLVAPVLPELDGVRTLVFAPSGRLRYVPFAALWDGSGWLVQKYDVALLSASGAVREHRPVPRDGRLLALSDPDGSLPAATAEAAAVRRAWGRRRSEGFDGAAATEDVLRKDAADVAILHLATHGHLDDVSPRDSWLLLAGKPGADGADGGTAHLTMPEIALLPLARVDLAVLSACETAIGGGGSGDEIAGLAYQFESRGVASIVASLWSVDDVATSKLMIAFYRELRKPGVSRAEALRRAQQALLADPATSAPYYWAPFVLIGDWR